MAIGKVIKGDDVAAERAGLSARPGGAVVKAEEFEASQAAKAIIENAHREAEAIREQGRSDAKAEFARAREEGKQQGLAGVAGELAKAKLQAGELLKNAEPEILELALKVAEKIIGADVQRDPRVLAQMCATAVETARNVKAVVLRVHPQMGQRLRDVGDLGAIFGRLVDITIKDDPEVQVEGCVLQTEFGTIDGQLKTQIEMLRNVLIKDPAHREGPA